MSDQRQYKRLKLHLDIKYRVLHSIAFGHQELSDGKGKAHAINLSEGGLLFETKSKLPVESLLEVELSIPNEELPVYLKGEVVHIEELSGLYDIGLRFEYKNQSDSETLHNFLQDQFDDKI